MSEEKQFDYENDDKPYIVAYEFPSLVDSGFELVPSVTETKREWMDSTPNKFAYRCLPLLMANSIGWQIKTKFGFVVHWNGGIGITDLRIDFPEENKKYSSHVLSHFGSGVLTFSIPWLFKTSRGHNLFVSGPINEPKSNITPLSGIVETDWLPFTFTMNWKMTTINAPVVFHPGDTICQFFPYPRGYVEKFTALTDKLSNNVSINEEYKDWSTSRREINKQITDPTGDIKERGKLWEKNYFKGLHKDGTKFEEHQVKINSCPFIKLPNERLT